MPLDNLDFDPNEADSYFGFKIPNEDSERHFRELADTAPVLIWVAGDDKECTWFNRRWREFTGKTLEHEKGTGWMKGIHPDDHGRFLGVYLDAFEIREQFSTEYRLRRFDGEYRWIHADGMPRYEKSGEFLGYIGSCIDITESRKAAEALAHSEARLDRCVRGTMDGLWEWPVDSPTFWGSPRFWEILGSPDHDETGTIDEWNELLHPDDLDMLWDAVRRHLEGIGDTYSVEFRMRSRDGDYRWMDTRGKAERDDDGKTVLMSGSIRNIERRKELEFSLRDQVTQRDRFLAMLSHELRNPLGAVLNSAHVALKLGDDEQARTESLEIISQQSRHMGRLLDDLLDVSRVVTGRFEMRMTPFDLRDAMDDALSTVGSLVQERGHTLKVSKPDKPVTVTGDRERLVQAQVNLLTNAVRYTPNDGSIDYGLAVREGDAVIQVADTGVGIEPALIGKVFDLFVQGDQGLAHAEGGMGVGLSLVRTIADAHEGDVTAESPGTGHGSVFTIRIPLNSATPKSNDSQAPATQPVGGKIVLVDDMVPGRRMLARWLVHAGYEVVEATTGEEGLEAAMTEQPAACLIDIGLPDIDGYEVARRLRNRNSTTELFLIAVTGYGRAEDRKLADDAGFDAHLVKPVDPDELLRVLTTASDS